MSSSEEKKEIQQKGVDYRAKVPGLIPHRKETVARRASLMHGPGWEYVPVLWLFFKILNEIMIEYCLFCALPIFNLNLNVYFYLHFSWSSFHLKSYLSLSL